MRKISFLRLVLLFVLTLRIVDMQAQQNTASTETPGAKTTMMARIAEIEIFPEFLEEYKAILKEEAAASVKIEPGVISIFPMYEQENPTLIRILEIYADTAAYQAHLQTPHFKHYKTTTLKMVKSLNLVSMEALDPETMTEVFKKLK